MDRTSSSCGLNKGLMCFRHLSESRFLIGALRRGSKFVNFCYSHKGELNAKPFASDHNLCTKKVSFLSLIFKNQIFSLFPIVK